MEGDLFSIIYLVTSLKLRPSTSLLLCLLAKALTASSGLCDPSFVLFVFFFSLFFGVLLFSLCMLFVVFDLGSLICFSSALNSETNEHVAIKKIANAFDNKIDAKRTLREIKLLRHMDHENVSE